MQKEHSTSPGDNRSRRGFASMSRERQKEIASKGGHAAHQKGTAHQFTSDEARAAGRKGGEAVSRDKEHMAKIGREGGRRSHANRAAAKGEEPKTGVRPLESTAALHEGEPSRKHDAA
jgi:general stress protein YciG